MKDVHVRASEGKHELAPERDLGAGLALLQARYDGGAVSPAIFGVIKAIETDLGWLQHRGRP